jgi:hypothetical protein
MPYRPGARPPLADQFYYLRNFEAVLAAVSGRYGDLLTAAERRFIARFAEAPRTARALLVRMVMRRGELFREGKLVYAEIGAPADAVRPLVAEGWVDDRPTLSFDELQKLLTKAELLRHFGVDGAARTRRKETLAAELSALGIKPQTYEAWCGGAPERVYRLLAAPLCDRFRLLFFGNFRQDWSEFVLAELGIFAYEPVAPAPEARAFARRGHIDVFEAMYRCRERLHAGQPPGEIRDALPPPIADCDWLEERRARLQFQIAGALERAGDPQAAATLCAACAAPGARLRAIRLLARARQWEAAHALALRARQDVAQGSAERDAVDRLLPRLERRLRLPGVGPQRRPAVPEFELALRRPAAPGRVEPLVRDHLSSAAAGAIAVHYVENGLVNSLFGLLCWSAVFAPIPGAFFHQFHRGPADFGSGRFFARRRREFAACFAQLGSGAYRATIRRHFAEKRGIESPFVAWGLLDEELLECALACFPPEHLRRWFEWIAADVRSNRAGFPDLVEFHPADSRYRLIEVKGPGDRVQDNQRRLLEYCVAHGMPVAVCRVRWADG